MDVVLQTCAGLDVHQKSVTACLLRGTKDGRARKEIRVFSAMKVELMQMRDWLKEAECTHVVMESTGVYWEPVYDVLEGYVDLTVGNAQHIKTVPGRKTDVADSEWLARLHRHGLIRKSFVPPKPLRELRRLVRYRRKLIASRASERNRLLKILETANIKLSSVASDVFGVSGRLMLQAIVDNELSPAKMANMAKGVLRKKIPDLTLALDGMVKESHRTILRLQLSRLERLDSELSELDAIIEKQAEPYSASIELLLTIPGIERVAATAVLAEIGPDMTVFPRPSNLARWAGLCPGNNTSANKRLGSTLPPGNGHLRATLVEAAHGAVRVKDSYLRDKYYRLRARRGGKRAAVAIAHKLVVACHQILSKQEPYHELGGQYLDDINSERAAARLVLRLRSLGYDVSVAKRDPD